ncbi:MAG: SUMF1/EgtB/PvdO family nonheme iron enzyme [Polyangiales bacterium]
MSHSLARAAAAALILASFASPAPSQPRRRCPDGEHWTRGHCCVEGFDWRPSQQACICVDSASCNPGDPQPNFDAPPAVAPRGNAGVIESTAVADIAPTPPPPRPYGNIAAPNRGACPPGMAFIPGGVFQIGSPLGEGGTNEHPQATVRLSPYCIDRTEVTVASYRRCAEQGACPPPEGTILSRNYSAQTAAQWRPLCNGVRPDRAQHPMNCVDWNAASAYCGWVGGRLPPRPSGSTPRAATTGGSTPGATPPRARRCSTCAAPTARRSTVTSSLARHDVPRQRRLGRDRGGGSFPAGASPFGVLDLSGNVYEWCSDWYVDNYNRLGEAAFNPTGPATGQYRVIRGGGWFETDRNNVRAAFRNADPENTRNINLGFRCARAMR